MLRPTAIAVALVTAAGLTLDAQAPRARNPLAKLAEPWPDATRLAERRAEAQALRLFADESPLSVTLAVDLKKVDRDRDPNSKKIYPGGLQVTESSGTTHTIPLQINARGHLRRMARVCEHVPLRLSLASEPARGTVFQGQGSMKLIVQCRGDDLSEQQLLREYLAYRVFNVITPRSFRARLARVSYQDLAGKSIGQRYGLLLEDADDVAKRMEGRQVELARAQFTDLHRETLDTMMLAEYLLGNTDYSIYALHNVVIVATPSRVLFPVPYDFDVSGLVSPPYGIPDRRLPIRTVRDRYYRGPCRTVDQFEDTLKHFRAQREKILALPDTIGGLSRDSRDDARRFLAGFFDALKDARGVKDRLVDRCVNAPTM